MSKLRLRSAIAAAYRVCRDLIRGAAGTDGYQQYRAHLARHHPEETPLSREAHFRREFVSRWDGVRRCC